jgi:putative membrane-bound dehydrogenase-like protein
MLRLAISLALGALAISNHASELPVCPPDWKIELVASTPQINHPTVVCSAPDGRVFVAEDPMDISTPRADLTLGRIICFHPDGRTTVFAQDLYAIFGMQYLEGRLYVLHNPKFSVFDDGGTRGTNRTELIESTNPNPWALDWNDHVPANFRLGMDGFFYIAVGDKGIYGATGRDGKRINLHGGGILRMRPNGTELEIFCTGVRNILDVAMTDEDEIFTYDNTDEIEWMSRLTHMVEGGFYGYPYDFSPRRGYTLWMMADYGGGAATGTLCNNEDALPGQYNGNLFLADFGKRQILRVSIARDGATFRATSREDMFSKVPDDFYPVGIAWGADAKSIYICDWQHRDTKETNAVAGRLWKMSYRGISQPQPKPDWYTPAATGKPTKVSVDQLIAGLSHGSYAVRLTAQRLLSARGQDADKALKAMLSIPNVSVQAKCHAIWALHGTPEEVVNITRWSRPIMQRQAIRKIGTAGYKPARFALEEALRSDDPSLRFHAAVALGRIADKKSVDALAVRIDDPDPWVSYAIFTALNHIGRAHPDTWERIAHDLRSEFPLRRERTCYALRDTYDPQLVAVLSKIAGDQLTEAREAALRLLAQIHRKRPEWKGEWWAYHPVKSPPPEKSVEWQGTPQVLAVLRKALNDPNEAVQIAAIDGIREAKDTSEGAQLRRMFSLTREAGLKQALIEAFAALRDTNVGPLLVRALSDSPQSEASRIRIISALGTIKFTPALVALGEAAATPSTNVRSAAFQAISSIGGDAALSALTSLATNSSIDAGRDAISALGALKNRAAIPLLLEAYADAETRDAALEALTQMPDERAVEAYLNGLSINNAAVREKCRKALGTVRKAAWPRIKDQFSNLPLEVVSELQRVYKDFQPARDAGLMAVRNPMLDPTQYAEFARAHRGDPRHGGKLFFDANIGCAKCHTINGLGGTVGPDLTTVGSQFTRDLLIESVLYPSKAIREGYQQTVLELKDGDSISGAVKGESADTVTIQDAEARLQTVRKNDIVRRTTSALSLMPEGLQTALSLTDFADLISYLENSKASNSPK